MYLIIRSLADYYDHSEDPMYLVESKEDADEICAFFNEFVEFKNSLYKECNDYMTKWREENPYHYERHNTPMRVLDRIGQIKNLLKENFKDAQKRKLKEELAILIVKQKEWEEYNNKMSQAQEEFKEGQQWPNKFKHLKDSCILSYDASYYTYEMNLSTKEEVLGL